jgi:hypothetical protein
MNGPVWLSKADHLSLSTSSTQSRKELLVRERKKSARYVTAVRSRPCRAGAPIFKIPCVSAYSRQTYTTAMLVVDPFLAFLKTVRPRSYTRSAG